MLLIDTNSATLSNCFLCLFSLLYFLFFVLFLFYYCTNNNSYSNKIQSPQSFLLLSYLYLSISYTKHKLSPIKRILLPNFTPISPLN